MNKYEILENETKVVGGYTLHRIKALKDIFCADGTVVKTGDLGGWIEKKENLSNTVMLIRRNTKNVKVVL